jgi:uncharacterized membrane protein YuzA (DUF378 family)
MKKFLILGSTILAIVILVSPISTFAALSAGANIIIGSPGSVTTYGSPYTSYGNSYNSGISCGSNSLTLCSVIDKVVGYLNQILFLLIGLAVVVFVYYVFKYFIQPNEDRKQAGQYVMYSVIGFFVILSMWGLVNILQNTFGLGNSGYGATSWSQIQNIFPR